METEIKTLSGTRKAAILLVVLGDEAASAVYKNLPEEDLRILTEEITEPDDELLLFDVRHFLSTLVVILSRSNSMETLSP